MPSVDDSLSLLCICCLSLYLYFTYTHTHNHWSINETECGLDVVCISLSLTTLTYTHTHIKSARISHASQHVANGHGFGSQRWKYFEELDVIWTRKQRKVALHSYLSHSQHRSLALSLSLSAFFVSLSHTHNISFLFHSAWTGIAHISSAWMWFAAVESISVELNIIWTRKQVKLHSILYFSHAPQQNQIGICILQYCGALYVLFAVYLLDVSPS